MLVNSSQASLHNEITAVSLSVRPARGLMASLVSNKTAFVWLLLQMRLRTEATERPVTKKSIKMTKFEVVSDSYLI